MQFDIRRIILDDKKENKTLLIHYKLTSHLLLVFFLLQISLISFFLILKLIMCEDSIKLTLLNRHCTDNLQNICNNSSRLSKLSFLRALQMFYKVIWYGPDHSVRLLAMSNYLCGLIDRFGYLKFQIW